MNLFRRKTEAEKLNAVYQKLLKKAYLLSHTDRAASDKKMAEAEAILQKIKDLSKP